MFSRKYGSWVRTVSSVGGTCSIVLIKATSVNTVETYYYNLAFSTDVLSWLIRPRTKFRIQSIHSLLLETCRAARYWAIRNARAFNTHCGQLLLSFLRTHKINRSTAVHSSCIRSVARRLHWILVKYLSISSLLCTRHRATQWRGHQAFFRPVCFTSRSLQLNASVSTDCLQ